VLATFLSAHTVAFQSPIARHRSTQADIGYSAVQVSARVRVSGRCFSSSSCLHASASMILGSTTISSTEDFIPFLEDQDFEEDQQHQLLDRVLSYLPEQDIPPQTSSLLKRVTANYVYGTAASQPVTMREVLDVINKEYKSRDVPMEVANEIFDVSTTGEDPDESVVELLSFAALHRLPQEITLELLRSKHQDESPFSMCKTAFAKSGWAGVTFPKGLALRTNRNYASASERQAQPWLPSKKNLAAMAQQAVDDAKRVKAPRQQLQTRAEFLESMEAQLSATASPISPKLAQKDLLFFPNSQPLQGLSFKRMKRSADKKYAILKANGRAGFLSYAFFNFLFYSVGILWQWHRIAAVPPTASSSALLIISRKFARTFAALCVGSQVFKLPKLFGSVALAPLAGRVLKFTQKKLNISENKACILLVASMVIAWSVMVSIPMLSEFTKLKRVLQLEQLIDIYEVQPALLLRYASFVPTIDV
jgi:hypothetical protein